MLKRASFYALSVCFVALSMAAGCAKQEVVKKDEGIVPVAKQLDPKQTTVISSPAAIPSAQITPPPASGQTQKASSIATLQSALNNIYFDFDSAGLSESARSTLAKNAAALKDSSAKIRIEGNCDELGSAEYNLALGERRAKAAQQYLLTMGIKPDRLSTISYGKEKPAVQGGDEAARGKNRRDEFVVVTP